MSAWAKGAWRVGAWAGTVFGGAWGSVTDTHDGHSGRKRIEDVPGFDEPRARREEKERLRTMLERAFDPSVPQEEVAAEIREAAAPVARRLESGRLEIDWQAIAASVELEQRLIGFRAAFEREQQRLFDEDEEEVTLLTWH